MQRTEILDLPAPAGEVFPWVSDLARFPSWLDLVRRATPTSAADRESGPAWIVDLRARIGPLARSKRLRMVQTVCIDRHRARFERAELDGRHHAAWVLDVDLSAAGEGRSSLRFALSYEGSMFGPVVDQLLAASVERARPRLLAAVTSG